MAFKGFLLCFVFFLFCFCFVFVLFFFEETCESNPRQRMLSVVSIQLLLATERQDISGLKRVLFRLAGKRSSPFGRPAQVSTQVQIAATCEYVWPRL